MSTIGQALNNWLQRQNTSIMRQEATVCDRIPPQTREAMISISVDSAFKEKEMGAAITHDYTLGKVITGTRERVPIPRLEGTIGTYHTHPFGWPRPSTYDVLDALSKDDKISCIGATGKIGTKIACFTPNEPKWSESRDKIVILASDINDFNKKVGAKYRKRGIDLRKLLNRVGSMDYVAAVQALTPRELEDDLERTEKEVKAAESAIKMTANRVADAGKAIEVALAELNKAVTEEEKKEAEFNLRSKREDAKRFVEQARIEHEHLDRAVADAKEAAMKSEIRARDVTPVDSDEAIEFMREGATLESRRQALTDDLNKQLLFTGYKEEWRPQRKVNGWETEPIMFDRCKIIWETIKGEEEELPVEL